MLVGSRSADRSADYDQSECWARSLTDMRSPELRPGDSIAVMALRGVLDQKRPAADRAPRRLSRRYLDRVTTVGSRRAGRGGAHERCSCRAWARAICLELGPRSTATRRRGTVQTRCLLCFPRGPCNLVGLPGQRGFARMEAAKRHGCSSAGPPNDPDPGGRARDRGTRLVDGQRREAVVRKDRRDCAAGTAGAGNGNHPGNESGLTPRTWKPAIGRRPTRRSFRMTRCCSPTGNGASSTRMTPRTEPCGAPGARGQC